MNSFTIRTATEQDLDAAAEHGFGFIQEDNSDAFMSYDQTGVRKMGGLLIKQHLMHFWVCCDGDEMAGFLGMIIAPNIYNPKETLADIYMVDVFPKYRHRGVAKKLIQTAEYAAMKMGITSISISFKSEAIAKGVENSMGYTLTEYKLMKRIKE